MRQFFCAETCDQSSRVPVMILRPALPTRKLHLSIRAWRSAAENVAGIVFGQPSALGGVLFTQSRGAAKLAKKRPVAADDGFAAGEGDVLVIDPHCRTVIAHL